MNLSVSGQDCGLLRQYRMHCGAGMLSAAGGDADITASRNLVLVGERLTSRLGHAAITKITTGIYAMYLETGQIVRAYTGPSAELNTPAGCSVLMTEHIADAALSYISAGAVAARPEMSLSWSRLSVEVGDPVVITGIPVGTEVRTPGETLAVDDGELEWSSDVPGTFLLRFRNFPYQDTRLHVEVHL